MDQPGLEEAKFRYQSGQFVQGRVEYHAPFGVFTDVEEPAVKGLIKILDFLGEGVMTEAMYPELGTLLRAIVVGYNESNGREIYLSAKPSVLH